ncbi:MAG: prolyl oligopeptidase family serine peptidase, partial [Phycisphaerae bacterium]|nr:prolyl oligopeptidase family serine peptidase [Phycisphaerae bacterium]
MLGHASCAVLLLGCVLLAGEAMAQDRQEEPDRPTGRFEKCSYVSTIDGAAIDYALWYPADYDPSRPWPLIVFLHGSGEGGGWAEPTQPHAGIPVRTVKGNLPFLVVSPLMRGSWSINGPAERDVLDTIADVQRRANVDPDRIHLTGLSLGAFAGWALAGHYPDRFASLSVFAGGGDPEMVGNLRYVPTWVFHGSADNNVHVAESVRMAQAMQTAALNIRYTEFPEVKHVCWLPAYSGNTLYNWMADQSRAGEPRRITYRTVSLRHNRAYWATIESMVDSTRPAIIDVFVPQGGQIYVHALNVGRLALEPPPSVVPPGVTPVFYYNNEPVTARARGHQWVLDLMPDSTSPLQKRHGLSGPIQDVFWDSFVVVTSDHQDPAIAEAWRQIARNMFKWADRLVFKNFRFISAGRLTPELIQSSNLICVGTPDCHSILAQTADKLPLVFTPTGLRVHGKPASPQIMGMVMIYPNPLNPDRYLVVCSGVRQAVEALGGILQPPYLSPTPLEDLVVVTRKGKLLLQEPQQKSTPKTNWMMRAIPPRGAVFDHKWQLPDSVIQKLLQGEMENGKLK